jgi:hypothetical protein
MAKNVKGKILYIWQTTRSDGEWKDIHAIATSLTLYF